MSVRTIDLNCDLGELAGAAGRISDAEILRCVSSVNIACGAHAGDDETMRQTLIAARELNVSIGAHPGFADRAGMGRQPKSLPASQITDSIAQQLHALATIARAEDVQLRHVKPHGALYHQAALSPEVADAICRGVIAVDPSLLVYGLSGGQLVKVGRSLGLQTFSEVFADRNYQSDGQLVPREKPNAFVADPIAAAHRIWQMVAENSVRSETGEDVFVIAETVCVHGDCPGASAFIRELRRQLDLVGLQVRACR